MNRLLALSLIVTGGMLRASQPKDILDAVNSGKREIVKKFIDEGDLNKKDFLGRFALHLAVVRSLTEIVIQLLEAGADTRAHYRGLNPLGYSMDLERSEVRNSMVTYLCKNSEHDLFRLLIQRDEMALKEAILNGINVEQFDENLGMNALQVASLLGDWVAVGYLLDAQADPNAVDANGFPPLSLACLSGNSKVVKSLLDARAQVNYSECPGLPLQIAARFNHQEIVTCLVARKADVNAVGTYWRITPLVWAITHQNRELVECLLAAGADPNLVYDQRIPLTIACQMGNAEIIRLLIRAGAEVNTIDEPQGSPLHQAVNVSSLPAVRVILDEGGDVNYVCPMLGNSFARACMVSLPAIRNELLLHGADFNDPQLVSLGRVYEGTSFIDEIKAFMANPELAITPPSTRESWYAWLRNKESHNEKLKRYLLWSIAYKKEGAYEAIKKIKPQWFARATVVAKLMIHAAKVGNGYVVKDLYTLIKALGLRRANLSQILLLVFKHLARYPQLEHLKLQILAETLAPVLV